MESGMMGVRLPLEGENKHVQANSKQYVVIESARHIFKSMLRKKKNTIKSIMR